jgi:glycosyltransferase involved in cell wall biosynthesis
MRISVIICTHNRAGSLRRTLHSLTTQTLPRSEFEVLVVDNASTDDTQQVVGSFVDLPVRSIFESVLGLSHARNTGWQSASSPYVAFLDDHAEAAPNWLVSLLETFEAHPEQEIVVGGRVTPVFPHPKPNWLDASLLFCVGQLDVGRSTMTLNTTGFYLPGCNIAFLRSTLGHYGGFPATLGRTGSDLLSGEEILLQQKIKSGGGSILYTYAARVKHHVDGARLKKMWFVRRMYWEGVTSKKLEVLAGVDTAFTTELKAFMRQIFSFGFLFKARFTDVCTAAKRIGRMVECIRPY